MNQFHRVYRNVSTSQNDLKEKGCLLFHRTTTININTRLIRFHIPELCTARCGHTQIINNINLPTTSLYAINNNIHNIIWTRKICNLYVDRPRKFSVQHTRIAQTRTLMIVEQLDATGQIDPPNAPHTDIYTFTTLYTRVALYHFISAWYEHWTASSEQKRKKSNWLTSLVRLSYADPIQLIFLYIAMRLRGSIYITYGVANYIRVECRYTNCRIRFCRWYHVHAHILTFCRYIQNTHPFTTAYSRQSMPSIWCLDLWFKLDWMCTAFSAPLRLISY